MKITIATVTYNAAALLERTLRSVEQQDFAQVEHLIVDGNSTDHTLELVHHYQERNSQRQQPREIVCLSEPDQGLYDAMNKALGMATGQYILFLNAGDRLHSPRVLSLVAQAAGEGDEGPAAVVYGDTDLVDSEGRFLRHRRLSPPRSGLTWRSFRSGMLVCHQAFFAHTDLARHTLYDRRYRFSADFDWCIRIMREGQRRGMPLRRADCVVADYLSEGLTTENHKASLRERFHIMARHYGLLPTAVRHLWFVLRQLTKR